MVERSGFAWAYASLNPAKRPPASCNPAEFAGNPSPAKTPSPAERSKSRTSPGSNHCARLRAKRPAVSELSNRSRQSLLSEAQAQPDKEIRTESHSDFSAEAQRTQRQPAVARWLIPI